MTEILNACLTRHIALNSLKIAFVVGCLLNLINQGDNLLHGDRISWFHLLLNFLVPYCVASYSAAKNEIEQRETHGEQTKNR